METVHEGGTPVSVPVRNLGWYDSPWPPSAAELHRRVLGTSAAAVYRRATAPAIDLIDLEAPTAAEPEARDVTAFDQPVNGRLLAVQILCQILYRHDLLGHFPVQHGFTSGRNLPGRADWWALSQLRRGFRYQAKTTVRWRDPPLNNWPRATRVSADLSRQKIQLKAYDCDPRSVN